MMNFFQINKYFFNLCFLAHKNRDLVFPPKNITGFSEPIESEQANLSTDQASERAGPAIKRASELVSDQASERSKDA